MNRKLNMIFCLSIITLFIMASCATTDLTQVWKDDNYQGQISNVLVVGVIKQAVTKRMFEDEFVKQLQTYDVRGNASYRIFQSSEMLGKEAVLAEVKKRKIDAIVVTRLIDKKTVETEMPSTAYTYALSPRHGSWDRFYTASYVTVYEPGHTYIDEVAVLETNLYDTKSEALIWSAVSETFIGDSADQMVKDFVKQIITSLSKNGLIDQQ